MGALLSFSIIGGLLMLAMYLVYRMLLASANNPCFNRTILLLIYFLSFVGGPLILYTVQGIAAAPAGGLVLTGLAEAGGVIPSADPGWGICLVRIFLVGMVITGISTVITWVKLTVIIRSGTKHPYGGYTVVITDNDTVAPFSWMRFIVMSASDYRADSQFILLHELKHVTARHWIDLLIAQTVCIVNWFNPVAWLMRGQLMLVHEYQADNAVIDSGVDARDYQMLLIRKAVGSRSPSLANSLNHSKLKKRITMMYKEKSGAGHRLKALALVPALALALGVTYVPGLRAAVSVIDSSSISIGKGSEKQRVEKISVKKFKVTDIKDDGACTTVVIMGEGLGDHITVSGGSYTNSDGTCGAKSMNCSMTDGRAVITIKFPVSGAAEARELTLTVNGEEIPFDLENFGRNAGVSIVDDAEPEGFGKVTSGFNASSIPEFGEMTIYVDGKEAAASDLWEINPETIASMTIRKLTHSIHITTKK